MKIIVEYKNISNINTLRLKIKNELNKRNIIFEEHSLDICTNWLDIYFIDSSFVYNVSNTYLILKDNEDNNILFNKINKAFDYFFVFKEYYLVEKCFDWLNFNGKYEIKSLNYYEVDRLDGYKHIFNDKEKMIDYISMCIDSSINNKLDDIFKLRKLKDDIYNW